MPYAKRVDGRGWRAVDGPGDVSADEVYSETEPVIELSAGDKVKIVTAAVQAHLDAAAKGKGYDDIKSAVTYADEPAVAKFQAEGQALRAWRSLVWEACYAIQDDVSSGIRAEPTLEQLIAELPIIVWP